jgi:hypothetical protein
MLIVFVRISAGPEELAYPACISPTCRYVQVLHGDEDTAVGSQSEALVGRRPPLVFFGRTEEP